MAKRPHTRPRTASRVAAVQALFQSELVGESAEMVIEQFVRHRLGVAPDAPSSSGQGYEDGRVPDAEAALFARIVRGVGAGQPGIDRMIAESLPADWPLARIDPVLRALLRAAIAELSMAEDAPAVTINEYLDVAHGFFDGKEPGMVNGVLDRLARQLRPSAFAGAPQR